MLVRVVEEVSTLKQYDLSKSKIMGKRSIFVRERERFDFHSISISKKKLEVKAKERK